jgi:Na+/H+ antiporter NhaC
MSSLPPAQPARFSALSPLFVFAGFYVIASILANDFYGIPISVAFLFASIWSVVMTKGMSLSRRIDYFSAGTANRNILMMIWIFVLAGAFAKSAQSMGAVDATVNLALSVLPDNLLIAGIFIAACFISLAVGTSVGTIVALTPVAVGIAEKTGLEIPFAVAVVVGGAFFGDNLSFISDTTIAATRTQGCAMSDKFKANIKIVLPAAILVALFYVYKGSQLSVSIPDAPVHWLLVLPYLLVLVTAIAGLNVFLVLVLGIIATGIIGLSSGACSPMEWIKSMGDGIMGMGELIIVTLLAGGMLEMIRLNGGINYIIEKLTRHIRGKRGAEFCVALIVSLCNLCTANNTIAIITVGPIAKDIAKQYKLAPSRCASLLDTFSCVIQSLIPYGAQLLMAAGLSHLSPLNITGYLYYPMVMALFAIGAIILKPSSLKPALPAPSPSPADEA